MGVTFEQIKGVNKSIKTTDIKGKDYAEVNQRIKAFRMLFPNGTIATEITNLNDGVVVIKASVFDGETLLGTGHAYEKEGSTFINKTSYIENCETSAVGRALAMCGIGIDVSVASYEEVVNAIENQEAEKTKEEGAKKTNATQVKALKAKIKAEGIEEDFILKSYKIAKLEDMTITQLNNCIECWDKVVDSWKQKQS